MAQKKGIKCQYLNHKEWADIIKGYVMIIRKLKMSLQEKARMERLEAENAELQEALIEVAQLISDQEDAMIELAEMMED